MRSTRKKKRNQQGFPFEEDNGWKSFIPTKYQNWISNEDVIEHKSVESVDPVPDTPQMIKNLRQKAGIRELDPSLSSNAERLPRHRLPYLKEPITAFGTPPKGRRRPKTTYSLQPSPSCPILPQSPSTFQKRSLSPAESPSQTFRGIQSHSKHQSSFQQRQRPHTYHRKRSFGAPPVITTATASTFIGNNSNVLSQSALLPPTKQSITGSSQSQYLSSNSSNDRMLSPSKSLNMSMSMSNAMFSTQSSFRPSTGISMIEVEDPKDLDNYEELLKTQIKKEIKRAKTPFRSTSTRLKPLPPTDTKKIEFALQQDLVPLHPHIIQAMEEHIRIAENQRDVRMDPTSNEFSQATSEIEKTVDSLNSLVPIMLIVSATAIQRVWRGSLTRMRLAIERERKAKALWILQNAATATIQRAYRCYRARRELARRKKWKLMNDMATIIQCMGRVWIARRRTTFLREQKRRRLAATKLQAWFRSKLWTYRFLKFLRAISCLQGYLKGREDRLKFARIKNSTLKIQATWAMCLAKRLWIKQMNSTLVLQRAIRCAIARRNLLARQEHKRRDIACRKLQLYLRSKFALTKRTRTIREMKDIMKQWEQGHIVERGSRTTSEVVILQSGLHQLFANVDVSAASRLFWKGSMAFTHQTFFHYAYACCLQLQNSDQELIRHALSHAKVLDPEQVQLNRLMKLHFCVPYRLEPLKFWPFLCVATMRTVCYPDKDIGKRLLLELQKRYPNKDDVINPLLEKYCQKPEEEVLKPSMFTEQVGKGCKMQLGVVNGPTATLQVLKYEEHLYIRSKVADRQWDDGTRHYTLMLPQPDIKLIAEELDRPRLASNLDGFVEVLYPMLRIRPLEADSGKFGNRDEDVKNKKRSQRRRSSVKVATKNSLQIEIVYPPGREIVTFTRSGCLVHLSLSPVDKMDWLLLGHDMMNVRYSLKINNRTVNVLFSDVPEFQDIRARPGWRLRSRRMLARLALLIDLRSIPAFLCPSNVMKPATAKTIDTKKEKKVLNNPDEDEKAQKNAKKNRRKLSEARMHSAAAGSAFKTKKQEEKEKQEKENQRNRRNIAASIIQNSFRRFIIRTHCKTTLRLCGVANRRHHARRNIAARTIQALAKGHLTRLRLHHVRCTYFATRIQRFFRNRKTLRKWWRAVEDIMIYKRVSRVQALTRGVQSRKLLYTRLTHAFPHSKGSKRLALNEFALQLSAIPRFRLMNTYESLVQCALIAHLIQHRYRHAARMYLEALSRQGRVPHVHLCFGLLLFGVGELTGLRAGEIEFAQKQGQEELAMETVKTRFRRLSTLVNPFTGESALEQMRDKVEVIPKNDAKKIVASLKGKVDEDLMDSYDAQKEAGSLMEMVHIMAKPENKSAEPSAIRRTSLGDSQVKGIDFRDRLLGLTPTVQIGLGGIGQFNNPSPKRIRQNPQFPPGAVPVRIEMRPGGQMPNIQEMSRQDSANTENDPDSASTISSVGTSDSRSVGTSSNPTQPGSADNDSSMFRTKLKSASLFNDGKMSENRINSADLSNGGEILSVSIASNGDSNTQIGSSIVNENPATKEEKIKAYKRRLSLAIDTSKTKRTLRTRGKRRSADDSTSSSITPASIWERQRLSSLGVDEMDDSSDDGNSDDDEPREDSPRTVIEKLAHGQLRLCFQMDPFGTRVKYLGDQWFNRFGEFWPSNPDCLVHQALFKQYVENDYGKAGKLFSKAEQLTPGEDTLLSNNVARYEAMCESREKAAILFQALWRGYECRKGMTPRVLTVQLIRATEHRYKLFSNDRVAKLEYALLQHSVRHDLKTALRMYPEIIEMSPSEPIARCAHALALMAAAGQPLEASQKRKKAVKKKRATRNRQRGTVGLPMQTQTAPGQMDPLAQIRMKAGANEGGWSTANFGASQIRRIELFNERRKKAMVELETFFKLDPSRKSFELVKKQFFNPQLHELVCGDKKAKALLNIALIQQLIFEDGENAVRTFSQAVEADPLDQCVRENLASFQEDPFAIGHGTETQKYHALIKDRTSRWNTRKEVFSKETKDRKREAKERKLMKSEEMYLKNVFAERKALAEKEAIEKEKWRRKHTCAFCGRQAKPNQKFRECKKCSQVIYCDANCMSSDYTNHRFNCDRLASDAKKEAEKEEAKKQLETENNSTRTSPSNGTTNEIKTSSTIIVTK